MSHLATVDRWLNPSRKTCKDSLKDSREVAALRIVRLTTLTKSSAMMTMSMRPTMMTTTRLEAQSSIKEAMRSSHLKSIITDKATAQ